MNKVLLSLMILGLLLSGCESDQKDETWIADENIDMSDELLMSDFT